MISQLNKMTNTKMQTKNLMVFFLAIVSVLFVASVVNAASVTNNLLVTVNGLDVSSNNVGVLAGENVEIKAYFTSNINASDVKLRVDIEGEKADVKVMSSALDLENGVQRRVSLEARIPSELGDQVSDNVRLVVRLYNGDHETEQTYTLRVQRPSYSADVMSISSKNVVEAGELFPVDIVLKNIGYNKLNDVYVTATVSGLEGVERTVYFGDLESIEDKVNKKEDTASGRLYLQVPYSATSGVYNLEVKVNGDSVDAVEARQIAVENDFSNVIVPTSEKESVSVGGDAEFSVLLVNPTNKLKVYKVVSESYKGLSTDVEGSIVVVPAGASKAVSIIANADSEGEYDFDVSVFSGEDLVSTTSLTVVADGKVLASPAAVLTVILAIIFVVLLIVFIVLIGKKPEKADEFGESYY